MRRPTLAFLLIACLALAGYAALALATSSETLGAIAGALILGVLVFSMVRAERERRSIQSAIRERQRLERQAGAQSPHLGSR